jgi:hypothetical protein
MRSARRFSWLAWLTCSLLVVLGLSACALPRMIDSEVRSFGGASPAVSGATYRFERLPSQADSMDRDALEAMASQALEQVGLKLADKKARYTVQVGVQVQPYPRPERPYSSRASVWMGVDQGPYRGGTSLGIMLEPAWSQYTIHLVLREAATGQVAYESRAVHVGPWSDSANLLPAIFESALRDYPTPTPQPHTVVIELLPTARP